MNRKSASLIFLLLGMIAITIGISMNNNIISYVAIAFVVIALLLRGRLAKPRRR